MVTGQRPFKGEQLEVISVGVLQGQPSSLTALRPGVLPELDRVVTRTLAKTRGERYQTVVDLLGDLRSPQGFPTVVTSSQPDVPSIAVLPFADMSREKDQDYFCEGLAEELIDALARLNNLRVVSRTSAFQFKGTGHDLQQVAEKLKVRTVLEGSVRKAGNRLRINAQLINAEDGYHLWSERYDRDMDDVFEVQDEIARSVVEKLKVKLLGAGDVPLVRRPTENLEAYNLYLQGRHHWQKLTPDGLTQSLVCLEQALEKEPAYAHAHAGVAWVYHVRAHLGLVAPRDLMPKAREASLRALALDDTVAEAHETLAMVRQTFDWDWSGAAQEFRRALDVNPADAQTRSHYALLLLDYASVDMAVVEARRAVELNPLAPLVRHLLAYTLLAAGQVEAAIEEARHNIELNPACFNAYWILGAALIAKNQPQEAVVALREGRGYNRGDPMTEGMLGWALAQAGQKEEAETIARQLKERRRGGYCSACGIAIVHIGLGDHDQAFEWLSHAYDERDSYLCYLSSFYPYGSLRADPRFQALLRKMNFPAPA